MHDRVLRTTSLVSRGQKGQNLDGISLAPAISANGRFVAFSSAATNLVVGDTNSANDIFVYDRSRCTTRRVSVRSDGREANLESGVQAAISGDGRFVTFASVAINLVCNDRNDTSDIFLHDMLTSRTIKVSSGPSGLDANSGSYVGFDVYFAAIPPYGGINGLAISGDCGSLAFASSARNHVPHDTNGVPDVFVVGQ